MSFLIPRLLPKKNFREPFGLPKSKLRSPTHIPRSPELVNYLFTPHHKENPSPSHYAVSVSLILYPWPNCVWTTNISFLLLVSRAAWHVSVANCAANYRKCYPKLKEINDEIHNYNKQYQTEVADKKMSNLTQHSFNKIVGYMQFSRH